MGCFHGRRERGTGSGLRRFFVPLGAFEGLQDPAGERRGGACSEGICEHRPLACPSQLHVRNPSPSRNSRRELGSAAAEYGVRLVGCGESPAFRL